MIFKKKYMVALIAHKFETRYKISVIGFLIGASLLVKNLFKDKKK